MADEQMNDTWDASVVQASGTNLKRIVDEWAAMAQNKASQQAGLQDQLNSLFLKWANDAQAVTHRLAQDNATMSTRTANNHATWDNLIFSSALTNPAELAESAIGAKVAGEVRDAAKVAIDQAVANVAQTSAAAQGTTGVAQGAQQAAVPVQMSESLAGLIQINKALAVELAEIVKGLAVLLVKVTGEEATAVTAK